MDNNNNRPNRHARRATMKQRKSKGTRLLDRPASAAELKQARKDSNLLDPEKVARRNAFREMWDKVRRSKQHFELPKTVSLDRHKGLHRVKVINKDGHTRELLPDVQGQHVVLCKRSLAKVFKSDCCIFARITQPGDGSWAICPAALAMSNQTTVQFVRRRSWWFLRRYSYEISFDGRIQPAYLFFDYGVNPTTRSLSMYVTYETKQVRDSDEVNEYFRFWLHKPQK